MITAMEVSFWAAVGLVAYAYFGYPALVWMLARVLPRPVQGAPITPTITALIAARNEATQIAGRIENCLALSYPVERFNVVVVSDGSTDRTAEVVGECISRFPGRVRLIRLAERSGKASALNAGAREAS